MERLLFASLIAFCATSSFAQPRPSTIDRPCAASQQLVATQGAVVLGLGGYTYDRFVRDRTFCEFNQYTKPAFAPSLDTFQCFVGYRCVDGPRDWFGDD